ncbi:MAG TPA: hypothetical protein VGH71_08535 [Gammaproteobacteria bacterium]
MNVPSSTSSSRRLPALKWSEVLPGALALLLAVVSIMEAGLALRGIKPNPAESVRAWVQQRARADSDSPQVLALIGSSRMLLDTDLTVLRRQTGREPVQLGLEGSAFVPVLQGLAADPAFRGSVLVDLDFPTLFSPQSYDAPAAYERYYQEHRDDRFTYAVLEDGLADLLHRSLRSYADGSRPATALWSRLVHRPDPVQYLKVLPDREILADYAKTPMPYLYYFRALRNLDGSIDLPPGRSYREIDAHIRAGIAALRPQDDAPLLALLPSLKAAVEAIRAKGGQVYFVAYPRSGYVRETDDRRFPRNLFWERLTAAVPAASLNFEDVPAMTSLICPDGSHLDYRERQSFTEALVSALHLDAAGPR